MDCKLCLKYDVDSFDLDDDEAKQRNAQFILQKYFFFCFTDDRKGGRVCRKCWHCVETFNNFYLQVEYVHVHLSSIGQNKTADAQRMDVANSINGSAPVTVKVETVNDEAASPPAETPMYSDSDSDWAPDNLEISMKVENEPTPNDTSNTNIGTKSKPSKPKKAPTTKKEKITFQCEECGDWFTSQAKLRSHEKKSHDIVPFKCSEKRCRSGFQTSKALSIHISQKHGKAPCPHCQREVRKQYLATHIKINHSTESQVICDLCGKVSSCKSKHKLHIDSQHTDHPSIQCDICGQWFKNKIRIRFHMLNFHIKNKPVKCEICGWVSPNRIAFWAHRKKKHVEGFSTRFKCLVCGHGFGDRTKLREHSYIHSGITDAYKCPYCDKSFRFGSSLSLHKKKCPLKNE